jgi:hypothetical protein
MEENKYEILFNQRHEELRNKEEIWRLIYNSYLGGMTFLDAGYLAKYSKESAKSFAIRKKRAVYFNQTSPIVDMLSGLLFLNEPIRNLPEELSYLQTNISGNKSINEFMRIVAAHTFMFTCAILVDSPSFDPNVVKTNAQRTQQKLNPYASMYLPFKIRDFNINRNDGELDWILLDNSYTEHTDPYTRAKNVTQYTLWTRTGYQNFRRIGEKETPVADPELAHGLGEVPVKLVSWRDDNNDFITETACEDIALISKLIFNNMSYMDEMLASGTFKMLAYPTKDGKLPPELVSGGVGALGVIPYAADSGTVPSFIGAALTDIDPFIKAIGFYMAEVLKKVGLSTDETKEFVKSGAAKRIDFQKMRALLVSGALMMSKLEKWICETAAKWEKNSELGVRSNITYTSLYDSEDLQTEVSMLTELLIHPVKTLRIKALNLIVKKLLGNDLKADELQEIYVDIDKSITASVTGSQFYHVGNEGSLDVLVKLLAEKIKNQKTANAGVSQNANQ